MCDARVSTTPALCSILIRAQYGFSARAGTRREGVPILRMGNIQDGHLDLADLNKYVDLPSGELQKYRLNEGDILFNRTTSLEVVGTAPTFTGLEDDWVFALYL